MDSATSLHRPLIHLRLLSPSRLLRPRLSARCAAEPQRPGRFSGVSSAPRPGTLSFSSGIRIGPVRVSSNGARFGSFSEDVESAEAPSFVEFITSERVKVAAMLALALLLCNADRVVMSVAIVPLSHSHGWTKSFAGIVQVRLLVRLTSDFLICS